MAWRETRMDLGLPLDLTWYKLLTDWGSLIGGGFAFIAGIVAYLAGRTQAKATREAAEMQVKADRRKHDQEVETLRNSLAIELRRILPQALGTHSSLKKRLPAQPGNPITASILESLVGVPAPIVYPAVADRIGLLQREAMDVVIVYSLIEIGRDATRRLVQHRTPDNLPSMNVAAIAEVFLQACLYSREVLPRLRTGVAFHDEKDTDLIKLITEAGSAWNAVRGQLVGSGFDASA
jgi:hypothetical protein